MAYFGDRGFKLDDSSNSKKSRTAVLVKNLPVETTSSELREAFGAHGVVQEVLLAPSKTTAVVQFEEPSEARAAFKRLAYRRFKHVPLYLEWAPAGGKRKAAPKAAPAPAPAPAEAREAFVADDEDRQEEATLPTTVFVKNLNFKTSSDALKEHFGGLGVRNVGLPPATDSRSKNRGYGFVEFESPEDAREALSRSSLRLDGHALALELSSKKLPAPKKGKKNASKTKLVVRNLAFAVTAPDVQQLFAAFGTLKKVRLPKRFDGRHRGFAFVDFAAPRDAENAKTALKAAHLYGRHLVIEYADDPNKIIAGDAE